LRTCGFQGWHKTRCCFGVVGPDIGNDLKRILPRLRGEERRGGSCWVSGSYVISNSMSA
jgi:hypothetical protein